MSHITISFIVLGAAVVLFVLNRVAPEIVAVGAAITPHGSVVGLLPVVVAMAMRVKRLPSYAGEPVGDGTGRVSLRRLLEARRVFDGPVFVVSTLLVPVIWSF